MKEQKMDGFYWECLAELKSGLGDDYDEGLCAGGGIYLSGGLWVFPDGRMRDNGK